MSGQWSVYFPANQFSKKLKIENWIIERQIPVLQRRSQNRILSKRIPYIQLSRDFEIIKVERADYDFSFK